MNLSNISLPTPAARRHLWAVLLAGGDGTRLRDLTARIAGDNRPKQFCPIIAAESLLSQTRARLDPLFSRDRQVFVVSRAHEMYYSRELADARESLVVAQPMNRGTAVGIIIALVQVMQADPDAFSFPIITTPIHLIIATAGAQQFRGSLVIVGAKAEYAETEYGWIEPGLVVFESQTEPLYRVNRFWEKPTLPQARALLQSGCLWNTFVTIGSAATLLELICSGVPDVVLSVTRALADNDLGPTYAQLPIVDFSRDILAHQAKRLLVLRDSGSGWADLGSPNRVLGLLARSVNQPAWFRQINGPASQIHAFREAV